MPEENYFTNSFAFLLRSDSELLLFMLRKLFEKHPAVKETIESLGKEEFDVKTQVALQAQKAKVDILITAQNRFTLFIENKIEAGISIAQVRKYLDVKENYLKQHANAQAFILFITMLKRAPERLADLANNEDVMFVSWSEMNDYCKSFLARKKDTKNKYFLNLFLEFMESKGMKSFSGFKLKDYAKDWEGYSDFRENATMILDEVKEWMLKKGFDSYPKENPGESEGYLGYSFRRKHWKWRFYFYVSFQLAPSTEDKKQYVWFGLSLYFQKTFREALRKKYFDESTEISRNLEKEFEITWDQDEISRYEELSKLIKGARSREAQRKRIVNFVISGIEEFEKSGLVKLAENASKKYKP
jgi:hypothetical protein